MPTVANGLKCNNCGSSNIYTNEFGYQQCRDCLKLWLCGAPQEVATPEPGEIDLCTIDNYLALFRECLKPVDAPLTMGRLKF